MAIERFSLKEFEAALPTNKTDNSPLWERIGTPDDKVGMGEYVYAIQVNSTNKRIIVRSSVDRSGFASDTGQNSIRMWVEYNYKSKWFALGKGDTGVYTTRVAGWQDRMDAKLRELYQLALDDNKGRKSSIPRSIPATESAEEPTPSSTKPTERGSDEDFNKRWAEYKDEFARREAEQEKAAFESDPDYQASKVAQPVRNEEVKVRSLKAAVSSEAGKRERTPNPEQLEAIQADVDVAVRVLAPPGSGKTFVIERRNAKIIKDGISPDRILNVTFSKNMADSGRERVCQTIQREVPSAKLVKFRHHFSTIHAMCFRILKEEGDTRDVAPDWKVKRIIQELAEQMWPRPDDRPGWSEIRDWINMAKAHCLSTADDLLYFKAALGDYYGRGLHDVRRLFDLQMRSDGLFTFPDMLFDVEQKLKLDPQFRNRWQARWDVINVDEGQDTSGQAMRILSILAEKHKRFFIVGDTDQLLYRFAGATPEDNLYEGYEQRYPAGQLVKLVVNYRSTRTIINASRQVIAYNYEDKGGPYEQRYMKNTAPCPDADEGEPISFQMYGDAEAEARALVETVQELLDSGANPGDIFVGARTRAQLGYLEGPLVRAKIPFINAAGGSFWGSKHVADVVAYLRLAADPSSKPAFKRIYNIASQWMTYPWGDNQGEYCHHRFLGRAFLSACGDDYRNVWRAVDQRNSFRPGVEDLTAFVSEIQMNLASGRSVGALEFVVSNGYAKYLAHDEGLTESDEAENGKLQDLETVIDVARQFATAEEFLAHVDEMLKAAEAAKDKDWDEFLVISTVHRLKGQERPVVFGVGICEGEDGENGLMPHTFSLVPPQQLGVLPSGGMSRMEDERDIFYVLISRAQVAVYLSGPVKYRGRTMTPSRFVYEAGIIEKQPEESVVEDVQPGEFYGAVGGD